MKPRIAFAIVAVAVAGSLVAGAQPAAAADTTRPVATIFPSDLLRGTTHVRFSENVRLVLSDNVVVRVAGSAQNVASVRRCFDAAGRGANCSRGPVRRVEIRPHSTAPRIAGQRYDVLVNPSGARRMIEDPAGNDARVARRRFQMAGEQPESAAAFGPGAWTVVTDAAARDGRFVTASMPLSFAEFRFRGSAAYVRWISGPDQGTALVSIDGAPAVSVDNYTPERRVDVLRRYDAGSLGLHTIRVEVAATGNPASSGTAIGIDGWVAFPTLSPFACLGAWVDQFDMGPSNDVAAAIATARAAGVCAIHVQTARARSDDHIANEPVVREWLERSHDAGMLVVGWHVPCYGNLTQDANRTARIASYRSPRGDRFDALTVDVEFRSSLCEPDRTTFHRKIVSHLQLLRKRIGSAYPVGVAVVPPLQMALVPETWRGFPWSSFRSYANVMMPMGYFAPFRRPQCNEGRTQYCAGRFTSTTIAQVRALTRLPVHQIGGLAEEATDAETRAFANAVRTYRPMGWSYYDLFTTRASEWAILGGISRYTGRPW